MLSPAALRRVFEGQARRLGRVEVAARAAPAPPPPFGPGWCGRYLPRYFPGPGAGFHAELFDRLRDLHARRESREAVIAPREGAKSTLVTLAYVLHCAAEGLEPYTLILSDSAGQAQDRLRDIRHELETNGELARSYPGACGVGPEWRQDRVTLRNGCVVQALGTGGRIRGRHNREARPSLVVFDDVENNDTIVSAKKRDRAWRWATREVIPAGSAGTNFLSVGSAIHREAVAVRLGQLAGWAGRTYRAVLSWPDRMDLWLEWERKATNLADPDRGATAAAFLAANPAMLDGGVSYWPQRWPIPALMARRAEVGPAAFDTEYQGVPSVEGLTEFPAEYFDRPGLWFDDWPDGIVYRVLALDPSKGSDSRTGDYQAHVMLGLVGSGEQAGNLFVDAVLNHEQPTLMVARSLDLARSFGPLDMLAVEDNDGLGMVAEEFRRQLAHRRSAVPWVAERNTQNKVVRIRRLGAYLHRTQLRFRNTPGCRLLVEQLRDFPAADRDDGPDCLELAVRQVERAYQPA